MKAVTDTKYYDEIAKQLLSKGAVTMGLPTLAPAEMAVAVDDVAIFQFNEGRLEGEAAGKQAAYDEFWDTVQNKGARTNYTRYFSSALWTDEFLKIKYDMVASAMYQCFRENSSVTALDLKSDGSPLVIDGSSISTTTGFQNTFYNCVSLVRVGTIISRADAPWTEAFRSCVALQEIQIEGTIGKAFDIHWSTKLSGGSMLSILKACNKESAGVTITLPAKCIDGKTATETYIANDTELSTALANARTNGYTVAFN